MRKKFAFVLAVALLSAAPIFAIGADSDGDLVKDRKDQCPATPKGAWIDKAGCPIDHDTDGVANGIDQCSKTPDGWPVDQIGCPIDSDKDNVADGQDSCQQTLAGARVDARGCPSDADGDLVLDGLDRCDGTPSGHRVEAHGCPVDSDHDGINDSLDQCADSRPTEEVDAAGCRVKAVALFENGVQSVRLDGLGFEKNRIEIDPAGMTILRNAALSLNDWPEGKVEIAVHTDKAGSASANRSLSQRRADFVKSALVTYGVDEGRLSAKGYGEKGSINERFVELKNVEQVE